MTKIQLTWFLLHVLIIWDVLSVFTEAAKLYKFDLNEPCTEDEDKLHCEEAGPSNPPLIKSSWIPYIPAEISDFKLVTLVEKEKLLTTEVRHYWDFTHISLNGARTLCTKVWAQLKVKGLKLDGIEEAQPVCSNAIKKNLPGAKTVGGGYVYTGLYHFIDAADSKYHMNLLRCQCSYKVPNYYRSIDSSRRYFLMHEILPKEYLILSPVNPELTDRKGRSIIHLVDFVKDP